MAINSMFSIEARNDEAGLIIIVGKASRKQAATFLNIPVSAKTHKRLEDQIIGSLAMGTSGLIDWALDELNRQGISLLVRPQSQ